MPRHGASLLVVLLASLSLALALAVAPRAAAGYLVVSKGADLWLAKDDGTGAQLLVSAAQVGEARLTKPALGPGSDALAFESWNSDSTRVYDWQAGVVRKVGNGWARGTILGGVGTSSNDPDVTADGRVLFQSNAVVVTGGCFLYGCSTSGDSSNGLVSVRFDGEDKRAHPAQCTGARNPAGNPANAAQLAYLGCSHDLTPNDPWDATFSALRTSDGTTDRVVAYDDVAQADVAWSPDGTQLVTSEGGTEPGIWVYPADGNATRLAVVPEAGAATFASPRFMGGDRIIFVRNGDVWSVPATCDHCAFPGQATQLTHLGGINEVAWTSAGAFRTGAAPPQTPQQQQQPGVLGLRAVAVRPASFRALPRGASVVRKGGALVTFTLSEAARVTFGVRRATGATVKGTFSVQGKAGANRLRFSGRLRKRTLKAGRYRLVAQARAADGRTSPRRTAAFTVRR